MEDLGFVFKVTGLKVSFKISVEVPAEVTPVWDFGDFTEPLSDISPTHTYTISGFYNVTLTVGENTYTRVVVVNVITKTSLIDSIYNLINYYIPQELSLKMSNTEKSVYITKWQLYLQPLVDHDIPLEEYNNELYYEGLENQLIMELAVYDYLYVKVINLLTSTAKDLQGYIGSDDSGGEGSRDRIKQITTGPTEVQYYDEVTESISALYKAYSEALKPGGLLDQYKVQLCMLAARLDIMLPICEMIKDTVVPSVVNRRGSGFIGGPNPPGPVGKPGPYLIHN